MKKLFVIRNQSNKDMKRKSFITLWMTALLVSVCMILQGKVKAYASEEIVYMSGADALSEENGSYEREILPVEDECIEPEGISPEDENDDPAEEGPAKIEVRPVISMNTEYEYAADIGIVPEARVTAAGFDVRQDESDHSSYTVYKDDEEIGCIDVYYVNKSDMSGHKFPDDLDEIGLNMIDETAGSYAAAAVFTAGQDTGYQDSISDTVYFNIIPAKLKLSAGKNVETVKYKKVSDVIDAVWADAACERINVSASMEEDDRWVDINEITDGIGSLSCVIDGSVKNADKELTICGTFNFKLNGSVAVSDENIGMYSIEEYNFSEHGLTVYSDGSLDGRFKKGRKWYYGGAVSDIPGLFEIKYASGRDGYSLKEDSVYIKCSKDREWTQPYTDNEVSGVPAENGIYYRIFGKNENDETLASEIRYAEIERRPVKGKADSYKVERANPRKYAGNVVFPYKKEIRWDEVNFTFEAEDTFEAGKGTEKETWSLPYRGKSLTAGDISAEDIFEVDDFGLPYMPFVSGIYEVGLCIDFEESDFYKKNIYLDEVDFNYEILPKYYITYIIADRIVYEGSVSGGVVGSPVTYPLKCSEPLKIPDGMTVYGWSFYDWDGYHRIKSNSGSRYAAGYEEGIDGTHTFTDTDVVAVAKVMSEEQGVRISRIEQVIYDGRAHVAKGMPADGKRKTADLDLVIKDGGYTLVYGEDYTVRLFNNVNASVTGKELPQNRLPRAEITGRGDYKGFKKTVYFSILPRDISDFTYSVDPGYIWREKNGKVHIGKRSITGVLDDGAVLKLKPSDYIEDRSEIPVKIRKDDVLSKSYTLSAQGKGNYFGYISMDVPSIDFPVSFTKFRFKYDSTIEYKDKISVDDFNVRVYTPKGRQLEKNEYTLEFEQAAKIPAGSGYYKIKISPTKEISWGGEDERVVGSKVITVRMKGEKFARKNFSLSWTSLPYDGAGRTNLVVSAEGFAEGKDYECEWIDSCKADNKAVGTYTVRIIGKGKYANYDRNGNPAVITFTFKRTLSDISKADNIVLQTQETAVDKKGTTTKVTVTVKNADGTETVYTNHMWNGTWTKTLVSADGTRGFTVTSWGKNKTSGESEIRLRALNNSGYRGSCRVKYNIL